jgi:hypothetical protein
MDASQFRKRCIALAFARAFDVTYRKRYVGRPIETPQSGKRVVCVLVLLKPSISLHEDRRDKLLRLPLRSRGFDLIEEEARLKH